MNTSQSPDVMLLLGQLTNLPVPEALSQRIRDGVALELAKRSSEHAVGALWWTRLWVPMDAVLVGGSALGVVVWALGRVVHLWGM